MRSDLGWIGRGRTAVVLEACVQHEQSVVVAEHAPVEVVRTTFGRVVNDGEAEDVAIEAD